LRYVQRTHKFMDTTFTVLFKLKDDPEPHSISENTEQFSPLFSGVNGRHRSSMQICACDYNINFCFPSLFIGARQATGSEQSPPWF
jgi:hypothetical protein